MRILMRTRRSTIEGSRIISRISLPIKPQVPALVTLIDLRPIATSTFRRTRNAHSTISLNIVICWTLVLAVLPAFERDALLTNLFMNSISCALFTARMTSFAGFSTRKSLQRSILLRHYGLRIVTLGTGLIFPKTLSRNIIVYHCSSTFVAASRS